MIQKYHLKRKKVAFLALLVSLIPALEVVADVATLACARAVRNKSDKRKSLRIAKPVAGKCPPKFTPLVLNTDLIGEKGARGRDGVQGIDGVTGAKGQTSLVDGDGIDVIGSALYTYSGGLLRVPDILGAPIVVGDNEAGRTFISPIGVDSYSPDGTGDISRVAMHAPDACTLENLSIVLPQVVIGETTVTVMVDGQASSLSCMIPQGATNCSSDVRTEVVGAQGSLAIRIDNTGLSGNGSPLAFGFACRQNSNPAR
jgi:hypothetical protein